MKKTRPEADTKRGMKTTNTKPITTNNKVTVPASRIVLEVLLPFLNLDKRAATDAELFREVKAIADTLADAFSCGRYSSTNAHELINNWADDKKVLGLFRATIENCRKIIISASQEDAFPIIGISQNRPFWDMITKAIRSIVLRADRFTFDPFRSYSFPLISYLLEGALKGSFRTQKAFDAVWVDGLRAIIFFYVMNAYCLIETGRMGAMTTAGWHCIGLCQKSDCGKVFRKTRSNQEFCSLSCRTSDKQKRYRDRKPLPDG